jgi:hypothetical protein
MIRYDERYFSLSKAQYTKATNNLRLVFYTFGDFSPFVPKHEKYVSKQVTDFIGEPIEIDFDYLETPKQKPQSNIDDAKRVLDEYNAEQALSFALVPKIDKTLHIKSMTKFCGVPIRSRPIQMKYLRLCQDFQVTAGRVSSIKRLEYKKNDVVKYRWTFNLDDGDRQIQCVHFQTEKTRAKFEKIKDRSEIAVIGVYNKSERGFTNFKVSGVALVEF